MKKVITSVLLVSLALWGSPSVRADDDDIFETGTTTDPNVLILIDNSGSMSDDVNGVAKIDIAKAVVNDLLDNVTGVRFGIMSFNEDSDGAIMVAPIGTSISTMKSRVTALNADGSTPLGRAAQDVDDYFAGRYTDDGDDDGDDDDDDQSVTYPSPIQSQCQLNYVIMVTDGMPTEEPVTLIPQVATTMHTTDHSTTFAGNQIITVHTVGFDMSDGTALLEETASNGGGNFYAASDATELTEALTNALELIVMAEYSFAMPLIPSTSVTGGTKAYLASFEPSGRPFWKGHLKAYTRDAAGDVPVDADDVPLDSAIAWDAGELLAAKSASSRTIYTLVSGALTTFNTTNISRTLVGASSNTNRDKVVNFIRGIDTYDEDADGNTTEEREWKLGDIYHSNPVLVFPPPPISTDSSYVTFRTANASRTTILLAGANDGMLHAFRESDGQELWAFIPPNVLTGLVNLTTGAGAHPYYVDSTPVVTDIKIGGTWKTVVIFGQRRGGSAYYALDITNTSSPAYLWTFTDSELAETWSEPALGQIKMSDNAIKDVAFVGGGYKTANNNTLGRAVYVINIADGSKLWQYKTGSTNDTNYMKFSIPATPTPVDLTGDGLIDRFYVGDVGGQLWKFDVSAGATPPTAPTGGLVNNWTGKRLFVSNTSQTIPPASGPFHAPRAMYGSPELALDTSSNLWVFVGTGDRNYPNDSSSNRFYGIKDNTNMTNGTALNESNLVNSTAGTAISQGWYLLMRSNEKVLSAATAFNDVVFFSTYTSSTVTVCENPTGTGALWAVNMLTGRAGVDFGTHQYITNPTAGQTRYKDIGGGIPSKPVISPGSGGDSVVTGTSDGQLDRETLPRMARRRVRYWREVLN